MAANQNLRASDQLSFRVSADYNRHDGYQSHGLDASNRIEGRVSALFTPGSDLTALLFVSGYHAKGAMGDHGIPNVHPLPDDPWSVPDRSAAGNPVTALDRKSVVSGKSVSVCVDIGGSRCLRKKKRQINTSDT